MLVLGINFLILLDDIDLQTAIGLPLRLPDFNHRYLLGENGVTDIIPQQLLTNTAILFALVHERPQVQGEVDSVGEEHFGAQGEQLLGHVGLLFDVQGEVLLQQLLR